MLYFIGQVFPYIAAGIFVFGMAWRVQRWLQAPVPFPITLFPAPLSPAGRFAAVTGELVLFKSLRRGGNGLWLWAWLMHVSLALIIAGHIVGIYFLTHQFTMIGLSPQASSQLSAFLSSAAGIVFFASLLVLFYRRTAFTEVKRLSDPADSFELLLLMAIVVTGMHMRTVSEINLPAIRDYLGSLIMLRPVAIPHESIFISHFFLVNVLLLYFPFSKLVHMAGFVVNRAMLVAAAPEYPTPAGGRVTGARPTARVFKGGVPS